MSVQDWFYVCAGHLKDTGFCTPKIDHAAIEARKKKELEEEIERVKKEYEEKQKKKKEKDKNDKDKEKEKEKENDSKADDDKDKDKDKDKTDTSNVVGLSHLLLPLPDSIMICNNRVRPPHQSTTTAAMRKRKNLAYSS